METQTELSAKERIEIFRNEREIYIERPTITGGQVAGMPTYPTIVEHKGLDIKISIGYHKSNYKNRELAIQVFDLIFDELVKKFCLTKERR